MEKLLVCIQCPQGCKLMVKTEGEVTVKSATSAPGELLRSCLTPAGH